MTIKCCKIIFSHILKRGNYTQYYCFDDSGFLYGNWYHYQRQTAFWLLRKHKFRRGFYRVQR